MPSFRKKHRHTAQFLSCGSIARSTILLNAVEYLREQLFLLVRQIYLFVNVETAPHNTSNEFCTTKSYLY